MSKITHPNGNRKDQQVIHDAGYNCGKFCTEPMTKQEISLEEKIRQICTYYSDLGEGTAGYSLSEEQFQKLFDLFALQQKQSLAALREKIEKLKKHVRSPLTTGMDQYSDNTKKYNEGVDDCLSLLQDKESATEIEFGIKDKECGCYCHKDKGPDGHLYDVFSCNHCLKEGEERG